MKDHAPHHATTEVGLEAALAEYLQAGAATQADDLGDATPADAEEIREFLRNVEWMRRLAGPVTDFAEEWEDFGIEAGDDLTTSHSGLDDATGGHVPSGTAHVASGLGRFGDYLLLDEIARGGMGVVYRARQTSLNRDVALKMILSGLFASDVDVQRFRAEAQAAAHLHHPGIVPVFEVGERDGRHYYSMALIDGEDLNALVRDEVLPEPREAAELLARIADAVHYAHQRGVIHRDLKPANILLERSDRGDAPRLILGGQTQGVEPRITDFGLAKRIDTDAGITGSDQVLGTPTYMSPEQAAGRVGEIGATSDIYALGALLYFLLTGHPPFRSATVADTLRQVIHNEPVPPRRVNAAIPRDLETICLKCLQKEPTRRYADAQALAADLRRFLAGEPILARPVSKLERTIKWVRRQPSLAGLMAASLIAAMASVGLVVFIPLSMDLMDANRETELQKRIAEAAADKAERFEYRFRIALVERHWREGDFGLAREMLREVKPDRRQWEWYYLDRRLNTEPDISSIPDARLVAQQGAGVLGLAFCRAADGFVTIDSRGVIRFWDATGSGAGRELGRLDASPSCVAFSADGSLIAAALDEPSHVDAGESLVEIRETVNGRAIFRSSPIAARVTSLSLSADGSRIAVGLGGGSLGAGGVKVWSTATAVEVSWIEEDRAVERIAISPDGAYLVGALAGSRSVPTRFSYYRGDLSMGASDKFIVKLWEAQAGLETHVLQTNSLPDVLTFTRDGRQVVAGAGTHIRSWDIETGYQILRELEQSEAVCDLLWSVDGSRLASASVNGTVRIWDWNVISSLTPMPFTHDPYNPDSSSRGPLDPFFRDPALSRRWAGVLARPLLSLHLADRGSGPEAILAFGPEGQILAAGRKDGVIRFIDARPRMPLAELATPH